ncbi:molybdopterin synthase catalytic subunit MoaE [Pseudocolwellia sp. AS88]|uniref:molybdopterin synthase catalytic subunit MoaE n=1 Tax=Pseudocolwellia sp. AS88 TaxID=3063958 RepID=UPI0026EBB71C|nr:molybdopterin synthase catalytic subunit MoaE [Pseudocolwellia sp. AS88]MDO7086480.1 molybdopterin synthase catalytic subunit MoaE [Pseudocolwellia sp. AS88]
MSTNIPNDRIVIQTADFDHGDEVNLLESDNNEDGAVVTFCGRVRNNNLGLDVKGLTLEHYPGMTEKSLQNIVNTAREKWSLGRVTVIHRVGKLLIGEQIVFVGVTCKHRGDAFAANEFIMDFLKVKAPFWKKELTNQGEKWLDAKSSDTNKAQEWKSE